MRLFVALALDEALEAALRTRLQRLRARDAQRRVRWVREAGLHLTLKFLGEVAEDRLPALADALGPVPRRVGAPRLTLGAGGCFPNARRPRVLWIGLQGDGEIVDALHREVEAACETLGFPREARRFTPHVTLGRVRDVRAGVDAELLDDLVTGDDVPAPRPQSDLVLFRSHLSPQGARYERLASWTLGAA